MTTRLLAALLFFSCAAWGQAPRSILIVTDAEGVAGLCRQEQVETTQAELRQLLTGEINAAVEGFLAGGIGEIVVWDGHDGSQTLSITTLHPKAKLMIGSPGITMTFERRYSAVAFVGQHAMANVQRGIMAHSFSSLGIQNLLLNGKPIGEIGIVSALAGLFDTPVILLTGDQAAVDEIKAIIPGVETVAVKEGLGRYSCISLSAQSAREQIEAAATRAARKAAGTPRPYKITGPVTIEVEATTRNSLLPDARLREGAEVVDDRTVRYSGKDFLEAWTRYRRP